MILFIINRQLFYVIESFRVIKIGRECGMTYTRKVRYASIVSVFLPGNFAIVVALIRSSILVNNFSLFAISSVSTTDRKFCKCVNKHASASTERRRQNGRVKIIIVPIKTADRTIVKITVAIKKTI